MAWFWAMIAVWGLGRKRTGRSAIDSARTAVAGRRETLRPEERRRHEPEADHRVASLAANEPSLLGRLIGGLRVAVQKRFVLGAWWSC